MRPEANPASSVEGTEEEGRHGRATRFWGWGLPAHPSPRGWSQPGGHSLDELPSKGFQLSCCCCRRQQQVQALPRQHVTQDPQQALGGFGVIRIHGLQKKKKEEKKVKREERSHEEGKLQSSNKAPATGAELTGCQSHPVRPPCRVGGHPQALWGTPAPAQSRAAAGRGSTTSSKTSSGGNAAAGVRQG